MVPHCPLNSHQEPAATHFPFIPTRIAHHSPAKGKVAVAADIINCKEFTELSLPVKWAQPFPFPNHELSGQNFSGKRGKNEWIGQGVRPGIDGCWDSLGRTKLLQLSQWDRAKGTEQCSSSKGRQYLYFPAIQLHAKDGGSFCIKPSLLSPILWSFSPTDVNLAGLVRGPGQQDTIFAYGSFQGMSSVNFKITIHSH